MPNKERRELTGTSRSTKLLRYVWRPFPTNGLCCHCPPPIEPVLTPSVSLFLPALQDSATEAAAVRPARPRPPSSRTTASPSLLGFLRFKRSLRLRQLLDLGNGRTVLIGSKNPESPRAGHHSATASVFALLLVLKREDSAHPHASVLI
jgi:hypothetical protein